MRAPFLGDQGEQYPLAFKPGGQLAIGDTSPRLVAAPRLTALAGRSATVGFSRAFPGPRCRVNCRAPPAGSPGAVSRPVGGRGWAGHRTPAAGDVQSPLAYRWHHPLSESRPPLAPPFLTSSRPDRDPARLPGNGRLKRAANADRASDACGVGANADGQQRRPLRGRAASCPSAGMPGRLSVAARALLNHPAAAEVRRLLAKR